MITCLAGAVDDAVIRLLLLRPVRILESAVPATRLSQFEWPKRNKRSREFTTKNQKDKKKRTQQDSNLEIVDCTTCLALFCPDPAPGSRVATLPLPRRRRRRRHQREKKGEDS